MNSSAVVPFSRKVLDALGSVLGPGPVALHEPEFSGNEWLYLKQCLDSTFVSSVGEFVDRFEAELAAYTGANYAVAMVNGTAALHIALHLAGVRAGDEVLVPALTFIATANAVSYCGATPHFVDSDMRTFGLDPGKLRSYLAAQTKQLDGQCVNSATGRPIRALVPVHIFGHPVAIDDIIAVANDFNLSVVEDAAESLGSLYRGKHTGTFGQLGVVSFNGNKTITSGGGGAILTNDKSLAARAKHLTTTAKLPHAWHYQHDEIGYNYRMPNLNAALACAQLEQLPILRDQKRALFDSYAGAFAGIEGVEVAAEPPESESNYWLQTLVLDADHALHRDEVLELTNSAGYMTRPVWGLLSSSKPYSHCPAMELGTAEYLASCLLNVPSSACLARRHSE
jgi:perosamine synthetase